MKNLKMIKNRVMVQIDDSDTRSEGGIITSIRTERDAIKVARVLEVDNSDYFKGRLRKGDSVLVDQYDSLVAPFDDKRIRILEHFEVLGVVEDDR